VSVTATRMGDALDVRIDELKGKMKQLMGLSSPQARALRAEITQLQTEKRNREQDARADRAEQRQIEQLNLRRRESILRPEGLNRRMQIAAAGATARAQVEEQYRPLPAGQASELADLDAIGAQIATIEKAYSPAYVGPVAGRMGGARETLGNITQQEVQFRAEAAALRNVILKARSGGAVTDGEAQRFLDEMPTVNDPANVFEQKLRNTKKWFEDLSRSKRQSFRDSGYGRVPAGRQPSGSQKRPPKPFGEMSPQELLDYANEEVGQ
jgi:hypothetical protein